MIIPIKCFTCGKVLADKWFAYVAEVEKLTLDDKDKDNGNGNGNGNDSKKTKSKAKEEAKEAKEATHPMHSMFDSHVRGHVLDHLGLTKICCRRHMLGHVDFD